MPANFGVNQVVKARLHSLWARINSRIALVAAHDVVMSVVAFELAVWFAYWNYYGEPQPFGIVFEGTLMFAAVCAVVFWGVGLYRAIWYYASLSDLLAITKGVTIAILVFLPALFVVTRLADFPRLAVPLAWLFLIILLTLPRLAYRAFKDGNLSVVLEREADGRVPVLLVGAGDQADAFIREMGRPAANYRVVGIMDDKPGRLGREIRGVRVLAGLDEIRATIAGLERQGKRPQRIVVAARTISRERMAELLDVSEELGLSLGRMPRLTDFHREADGGPARLEVKPVDVADLLGRSQRVLDRDAMRGFIHGRKILVTGAGGTIGSELCRQIAAFGPGELVLLDNGEFNLYRIDIEIAERFPMLPRKALLADVRAAGRIGALMDEERPDIVFHAAALKHLPIAEANPCEAVLTNIVGTLNVAEACRAHDAAALVLISTDKAAAPTSIMGMTKRVSEQVCRALDRASEAAGTRFISVRFGNVLGSSGSVVPLFQRQLAAGGPLTVTDPEATRFFMSTREAVELVLQAAALRPDGSNGGLYVLDMGRPVKILDLARQMIRLAGLKPDVDIAIEITGLRRSEKLHETLLDAGEKTAPTAHGSIMAVAGPEFERTDLHERLGALRDAADAGKDGAAGALLEEMMTELSDMAAPTVMPFRAGVSD